ncbi:MAG: M12 family metallo-peptidase, partial [Flavobacteriales bacterium]|nr:M12 family metallo-peptidase [Flavobacteriales bacterium]
MTRIQNPSSYLLLVLMVTPSLGALGQWYATPPESKDASWQNGELTRVQTRESVSAARAVSYDHAFLSVVLDAAPAEWDGNQRSGTRLEDSGCRLTLPMVSTHEQGWEPHPFRAVRSDVMAPALTAKYPEIRSYLVQSERDGLIFGRIDMSPRGFHGILHTPNGTVYIDPWNVGEFDQLMVYTRSEFMGVTEKRRDGCDARQMGMGKNTDVDGPGRLDDGKITQRVGPPYGPTRRNYALALACTGEYGQFHGGNVSSVLSAMNTSINRVNSIVEPEMAIRLTLIPDNDDLIFLNGSTDPYTNSNGGAMLSQNQTTLDNIIGFNGYDIGHVFSTGGGGVAYLGSVCTSFKAGGVTGLPAPIGDPFDVDYVGHEMGHQFGCNHTFNNSCSGNRASSAAYEPGSGSTIMSYSGICAPNLQNNSDDVYHVHSLIEGTNFLHSGFGNSCATQVSSGNSAPTVSVGSSAFSIPKETPFELTATASDPNPGNTLTYSWEQYNLGSATASGDNNLNNPSGTAPCIRSFAPVSSPTRVIPKTDKLVNNQVSFGEHLPDYNRIMTFKCTVRDNNPGCGGVAVGTKSFNIDASTGPFLVTYPNTNISRAGNSDLTILWDVAGTDGGNVNCSDVDIYCSLDGGYTWPHLLAEAVPNTGSATVLLPAVTSSSARIKV